MDSQQDSDFNYFAPQRQPYHFPEFSSDSGYGLDPPLETASISYGALDSSLFLGSQFNYTTFDANVLTDNNYNLQSPKQPTFLGDLVPNGSADSGIGMDAGQSAAFDIDMDIIDRRDSDETESMTPAQSRRKAQNRAAQRAFRERKERHVRDLTAKLADLTTKTSSLQNDNERLKLLLQRTQTENEILRATRSSPGLGSLPAMVDDPGQLLHDAEESDDDEGLPAGASTFSSGPSSQGRDSSISTPSTMSWGRLLDAGAAWDLLQAHPLFIKGSVDVGEVCDRLKKLARCESSGPVFAEVEVRKVIEEVARAHGDDLL